MTLAQHLAAHGPLDVFPLGYFCTCGDRVHQRTGQTMWQARDEHIADTWEQARTIAAASDVTSPTHRIPPHQREGQLIGNGQEH